MREYPLGLARIGRRRRRFNAVTISRLNVEVSMAPPLLLRDPRSVVRHGEWDSERSDAGLKGCPGRSDRVGVLSVAVALVIVGAVLVPPAQAGPWSQLPDAIDRLTERPGDEDAERVVRLAEASILHEAQAGRLAVTRSLFDTYASLVSNLPDGITRLGSIERRLADRLLRNGDRMRSADLLRASSLWALAAELNPDSEAVARLRGVLLPPAEAKPGQIWKAPLDGAELVFHPAMTFPMGCTVEDGFCLNNEVPIRWFEVPALWVEAHEVSNRRYRLCVDSGSCTPPEDPGNFRDPKNLDEPVVGVSWRQARTYARWAGRRLPSEAEWERAARGEATDARFPWGNGRRRGLANTWVESRSAGGGESRPVGSFPTMGYGTADMAGNVWEWCQDRYQPRSSEASSNRGAPHQGWGRVVRGGSWRRGIYMARVSARLWYDGGYSADDLGFRCVVGHTRGTSANELVRSAQRAFPVDGVSDHELAGAELETEDRRYLERRAITLYVIEGRTGEALALAARRLLSEPRDPVAGDLFTRFETELLNQATGKRIDEVERDLAAYEAVAEGNRRLTGRFAAFKPQLVVVLRQAVSDHERRGDRENAIKAAELGLVLAPDDAILAAAVNRLTYRTGTTRVWTGDGKGMVWIEAYRFRMGISPEDLATNQNERPVHDVSVDGFWVDRTEVTNDEYRGCVRAGACTPPTRPESFDKSRLGDHPVLWVDWFQAKEYCIWAGKRLPTEAEWELVARSGVRTQFPWGTSWVPGNANAMGTYRSDIWTETAPVASFEANRWGVYDLFGNVSEWTEDVYNDSFDGAPRDGSAWYQETGPAGERRRVVRGGGYDDSPPRHRVSRRSGRRADNPNRSVGFRCVADD